MLFGLHFGAHMFKSQTGKKEMSQNIILSDPLSHVPSYGTVCVQITWVYRIPIKALLNAIATRFCRGIFSFENLTEQTVIGFVFAPNNIQNRYRNKRLFGPSPETVTRQPQVYSCLTEWDIYYTYIYNIWWKFSHS